MERLDRATTDLIEQEVRGRFPEGALAGVAVLQYGDDPAVEPGQIVVQVTVESADEPEGDEDPMEAFRRANQGIIRQIQRDIPQRWPQATLFNLTPVMARLGPADLETLDTLITAGIAANRAQAVRWALARIRERPAYAQLRERAQEMEDLKSQF